MLDKLLKYTPQLILLYNCGYDKNMKSINNNIQRKHWKIITNELKISDLYFVFNTLNVGANNTLYEYDINIFKRYKKINDILN